MRATADSVGFRSSDDPDRPAVSRLPDPVDGVAPVYLVGMAKRCYRCGDQTRVIAGLLCNLPAPAGDDALTPPGSEAGTGWRHPAATEAPMFRYVPLSRIASALAAVLDRAWYERHRIAPIKERDRGPAYQWTTDSATVCNGCFHCDAMLRDDPIQQAFEDAIGPERHYDPYVFASVDVPVAVLQAAGVGIGDFPVPGQPGSVPRTETNATISPG